jgi:hypothetical protein
MLRDMINEHLENMTRTQEITRALIPILKNIISKTATNRDSWDAYDGGRLWKTLKHCCKLPRYVPYKGTYVPYDGTYGTSDQGQTLDL